MVPGVLSVCLHTLPKHIPHRHPCHTSLGCASSPWPLFLPLCLIPLYQVHLQRLHRHCHLLLKTLILISTLLTFFLFLSAELYACSQPQKDQKRQGQTSVERSFSYCFLQSQGVSPLVLREGACLFL